MSTLYGLQLRQEHGNREQSLFAEPPFRERKDGRHPGLLNLIGQEGRQLLELRNGAIDYGRGFVRHDGGWVRFRSGDLDCKFIQLRGPWQVSRSVQVSVFRSPV